MSYLSNNKYSIVMPLSEMLSVDHLSLPYGLYVHKKTSLLLSPLKDPSDTTDTSVPGTTTY